MVRTVITPNKSEIQLSIPQEYIGKEIEITFLSLEELAQKPKPKIKLSELAGKLSHSTAEAMLKHVEESRNEWDERTK